MLRTNTKQYRNNVYKFLLNAIEFEELGDVELSDREKIDYFFSEFESQANYEYNLKRLPNNQERLADWIGGLPSCIDIPFANYDVLQLVESLHECEIPDNKKDIILSNYFNHLAYMLISLKDKLSK